MEIRLRAVRLLDVCTLDEAAERLDELYLLDPLDLGLEQARAHHAQAECRDG
jgi:hypothetical protein